MGAWRVSEVPRKDGTKLRYGRHDKRMGKSAKIFLMHRVILGIDDPKIKIDHCDGNGLNNAYENLRVSTTSQNAANKRKTSGASSQFKGIHWYTALGKWKAMIRFNGKLMFLGHFSSEEDAARAYDKAALTCFGEFAKLNFSGGQNAGIRETDSSTQV